RGKFLTIYTEGPEQLHAIVSQVDKLLRWMDTNGCFNLSKQALSSNHSEKQVGSLYLIRARYGSFTGDVVLDPNQVIPDNNTQFDETAWGMDDDKTRYKPEHIVDPFDIRNLQNPGVKEVGWYHHPWSHVLGSDEKNYRPKFEYDFDAQRFSDRE